MTESTKKQRLFEVKEYSAKIHASLANLERSQKPGEQSGKATKTAVLQQTKDAIQDLLDKGYTPKQIADALSSDVFGILPKTITQIVSTKFTAKKPKPKAKVEPIATPEVSKQAKEPLSSSRAAKQARSNANPTMPPSTTFTIQPDNDDL